jgi:hypothetical protein
VLTLFSWLTNIATLCVIALMALTTLAVIRYFKYGNPGAPEGTLRVFVLPLLSGIALCAVLLLAIANFSVLTGASKTVSYALTASLPIAAITGLLLAGRLKTRNPILFSQLGNSKI